MKIRPVGYGLKVSPLSNQAESRRLIEAHKRRRRTRGNAESAENAEK
jgi:hypothetical protein